MVVRSSSKRKVLGSSPSGGFYFFLLINMFATRYTIINWLKMTNLKKCASTCDCVNELQLLFVTRPKSQQEKKILNELIKCKELEYEKCKKKNYNKR